MRERKNLDLLTENSTVMEASAKQIGHLEPAKVHTLSHNTFTVPWLVLKHGCL